VICAVPLYATAAFLRQFSMICGSFCLLDLFSLFSRFTLQPCGSRAEFDIIRLIYYD
jgi:hypothetical protein